MYRPGRITATGRLEAMDDLVERNVLSLLKATGSNLAAQAAPQNTDLVSGLVTKVVALESENAALKEQLQVIHQLQQQQQQDQQQQSSEPQQVQQDQPACHSACEPQQMQQVQHLQLELQRLRQQCKTAWQQVAELKGFLNDYGLVWVGQPAQLEAGLECCSPKCSAETARAAIANHIASPRSPTAKASASHASSSSAAAAAVAAGSNTAAAQLPFDLSELQECLDELNQLAGDGIAQLKQLGATGTAAAPPGSPHSSSSSSSRGKALHLVTPEPIKLAIYKDGLVLHHCPPLPYVSEAADGILSDIFDGYFPSALKGQFPDGIPIQLVDRSSQTLAEAIAAAAAAAAQKGSNIIGWQDLEQHQQLLQGVPGLYPVNGQAFLDRLPKSVMRNQQVVSVRPVVEQFMNGGSSSSSSSSGTAGKVYIRPSSGSGGLTRSASQQAATAAAAAAAAAAGQQGTPAGLSTAPQQQQQQATIQVKSEDGKQTYVLMLPYTATVAALRANIDKYRAWTGTSSCHVCQHQHQHQQQQQQQQALAEADTLTSSSSASGDRSGVVAADGAAGSPCGVCCGYELRSAFPARLYADGSVSLEQAGLVPSATLFMRHPAA